ncbi:MAG: hypothetical protein CYG59_16440 [Chloroflexi bacterium]|nr:MAG: hypothetical protein CYG59_16440 [Chloroflexota bacterium]
MKQAPPDYLQNTYITFPFKNREGVEEQERITFAAAWGLFYIYKKVGLDAVINVAKLGALGVKGEKLNEEDAHRIGKLLGALLNSLDEMFEHEEDFLLHVTYEGLSRNYITRKEAADVVAWLTDEPMKTDTWRKKMDKYIESHGLPPLGLPMGRPKRGKPESNTAVSD